MEHHIFSLFRKETHSFFVSPIFYGMLFVFLVLSGYFFYTDLTLYNMINIRGFANPIEGFLRRYFNDLRFVFMLLMPLVTMRLYAEEKKLGTYELLTVSPVKDRDILASKFLVSITIFALLLIMSLAHICLLSWIWGISALSPLLPAIGSGYLGLFLLGSALASCGLFVSSLTENQAAAGMITLGIFILFWFLTWNELIVDKQSMQILLQFSLFDRLHGFFRGFIQIADIVFFIFFTLFFIVLTYATQKSRKWRML